MSSMGGGGGGGGPTAQQQALQSEQAITNAQLNLEENEQRKTILNALQGTRVFRGSALSRAAAKDTAAANAPSSPASSVQTASLKTAAAGTSLLDATGAIPSSSAPTTLVSAGRPAPTGGPTGAFRGR